MGTIQELADEAFADLLKKHGIPVDLKDALRKSASLSKTPGKTTRDRARKKQIMSDPRSVRARPARRAKEHSGRSQSVSRRHRGTFAVGCRP